MKTLFTALMFTGVLFASNAPKTVTVDLGKAYIPVGFDDNDRVQFGVTGMFRNTCYKMGPHALRVDSENKNIYVQQQAYVYGGVCLQMFVPFSEIIDVGIVPEGNYTIIDESSLRPLGMLDIKSGGNQPGPDDFLYAPVSDAYLIRDAEAKKHYVVVAGSFADRCSEFKEIKVNDPAEAKRTGVIVVQPVIEHRDEKCEAEKVRFLRRVELSSDLAEGIYLLHVRSLNGQAINKMVDVEG